ncbi:MAG TPA: DUF2971 domain-containing protein [Chitinophagales bacterium]|nr:DUF2971 domain-containing protein [Chitinophagales bacterium]
MKAKTNILFIDDYNKELTTGREYFQRFTTVRRFKEMINSKTIWFANPETGWTDPYEKYYLQSQFTTSTGKQYLPARGRTFGWCLSKRYNSEAYWQVYSPNKDGIRLRINASKLIKQLAKVTNSKIYIGKVEYLNSRAFNSEPEKLPGLRKEIETGKVGENQIRLMLKKRMSFMYEEEIRFFAITADKISSYSAPIDIMSITDEIHLDPRMDKSEFNFYKEELSKHYGLSQVKIGRSTLYQPAKSKIFETAK